MPKRPHTWYIFEERIGTRNNPSKYSKKELTQILLYGEKPDNPEKYQHNQLLFRYVQKYLIQTKRLVFKSKLQYTP